jgi:hypothetical protein
MFSCLDLIHFFIQKRQGKARKGSNFFRVFFPLMMLLDENRPKSKRVVQTWLFKSNRNSVIISQTLPPSKCHIFFPSTLPQTQQKPPQILFKRALLPSNDIPLHTTSLQSPTLPRPTALSRRGKARRACAAAVGLKTGDWGYNDARRI